MAKIIKKFIMNVHTSYIAAALFIPLFFSSYLFYALGNWVWLWMLAFSLAVGLYESMRQPFKKDKSVK